jgi:hypothetical protein
MSSLTFYRVLLWALPVTASLAACRSTDTNQTADRNLLADGGGDAPASVMSFFVTSVGTGKEGGNLGGLDGADRICQRLATAVGAGGKIWHAYLSTQNAGAVNARDRIGVGPWHNALGVQIAASLAELHGSASRLDADTARDETGARIPEAERAILTGTRPDGTAFPDPFGQPLVPPSRRTCGNWTISSFPIDAGIYFDTAQLGRADRMQPDGGANPDESSWNSAAFTIGCHESQLKAAGSTGRIYCFAIDP